MRMPTYEEYLANPNAILASVQRAARAERAEAVHRFLVARIQRAWRSMTRKPAQRFQSQSA